MNVVLALVDITFIIHTEIDKENTILGGTCKWNYILRNSCSEAL